MANVQILEKKPWSVYMPSKANPRLGVYIVHVGTRGVSYVDAFVREAWWDGGALFFGLAEQYGELFDRRHGDVSPIVSRQKGLSIYVSGELQGGYPTSPPCP